MSETVGVLKLVGISGFVKGEAFTVRQGESVSIGRSRSCSISLRDCPAYRKVDPLGLEVNEHLKTVSREHVVIQVKSSNEVLVHDGSSNGTFIDGKRIGKTALIKNLPSTPHEIKLGSNEAFRVEWRRLVKRRKVKVLEVPEGEEPPEGAVEIDEEEANQLGFRTNGAAPASQEKAATSTPTDSGTARKKAGTTKKKAGATKKKAAATGKKGETTKRKAETKTGSTPAAQTKRPALARSTRRLRR